MVGFQILTVHTKRQSKPMFKPGVSSSSKELDKSPELDKGDDKHDHSHEDGEVAVGLRRPVHLELPVLKNCKSLALMGSASVG